MFVVPVQELSWLVQALPGSLSGMGPIRNASLQHEYVYLYLFHPVVLACHYFFCACGLFVLFRILYLCLVIQLGGGCPIRSIIKNPRCSSVSCMSLQVRLSPVDRFVGRLRPNGSVKGLDSIMVCSSICGHTWNVCGNWILISIVRQDSYKVSLR